MDNIPMRQLGFFLVEDWSVNHDPGDEDDGLHKIILKWLAERGKL